MTVALDWQQAFDQINQDRIETLEQRQIREAAFSRFQDRGWPDRKQEYWRYTDLNVLTQTAFMPATSVVPAIDHLLPAMKPDALSLIIVNGKLQPTTAVDALIASGQLTIKKASVSLFSATLAPHLQDAITDLNDAFAEYCVDIHLQGIFSTPLHVIYIYTALHDQMIHMQQRWTVAADASVTIIEEHIAEEGIRYFSTLKQYITLETQADFSHCRLQTHSHLAYQINRIQLSQAAHSKAKMVAVDSQGRLVRNELSQIFLGEHASLDVIGMYIGKQKTQIDNYVLVDHASPHCQSQQRFKGILSDFAVGTYQGKVIVRPLAQKTDATQHHANLLLSDDAKTNIQPQLEIYADDIRCTHATTTGTLDEEALFYLSSRGIPLQQAKQMLLYGFMHDLIQSQPSIEIQSLFQRVIVDAFLSLSRSEEKRT